MQCAIMCKQYSKMYISDHKLVILVAILEVHSHFPTCQSYKQYPYELYLRTFWCFCNNMTFDLNFDLEAKVAVKCPGKCAQNLKRKSPNANVDTVQHMWCLFYTVDNVSLH